nr:MAG TPA: hypothetical protein [Caudoviricetes sp.]
MQYGNGSSDLQRGSSTGSAQVSVKTNLTNSNPHGAAAKNAAALILLDWRQP